MTIDDLKDCWDGDLPIDHCKSSAELKQYAVATARRTEGKASLLEFWTMAVFGAIGSATLFDAILGGEPWHCYPAPVITLGIVAYVYMGRRRRRGLIDFSRSLPEIVESELQAVLF